MNNTLRIIFGGDVMLGRLVKDAILANGNDYPMGRIASLMRQGDLTIVNLECAITTNTHIWSGAPKSFYFGAPPQAANILSSCGVKLVSLANNHVLDYDVAGLLDTLHYLKQQNIAYAGSGKNIEEARAPVYLQIKNLKFGMVAFCDHQRDFLAGSDKPGMAYLNLADQKNSLKQLESSLHEMQLANTDWPILSLHWGPNLVHRPSKEFIQIAHAAIDMGYKILFGHSAHVFHGIEIYRGCPIIYAAGDLVDDYYVDPEFKDDHQLLIELEIADNHLHRILLHPVFIANCQSVPAQGKQFDYIAARAKQLCQEFGTEVKQQGQSLIIS